MSWAVTIRMVFIAIAVTVNTGKLKQVFDTRDKTHVQRILPQPDRDEGSKNGRLTAA